MFSKDEKISGKEIETTIGATVKVRGDFRGNGNILIDGDFDGSLITSGNLHAGVQSKIKANIEANEATIEGAVEGNIKLKGHIEIGSTANVKGDIYATSIGVTRGAIINGKINIYNQSMNPSPVTDTQAGEE
jgi:cytoskeletal protein CcmA (bactofilin family)